jgi:hypothetical protein
MREKGVEIQTLYSTAMTSKDIDGNTVKFKILFMILCSNCPMYMKIVTV